MADSKPEVANSERDTAACDAAFAALKTYDAGSARAALLPIDQAVAAVTDSHPACTQLEKRLLSALEAGGSAVAREYICSKLTLLGSVSAVPALVAQLDDARVSTAARTALDAIPDKAVSKALGKKLPAARGLAKIGIINSLAARRDPGAASALADCLGDADPQVAVSAAAALGEIGTAKAARILRQRFLRTPESLRRNLADALLVCAERLRAQNRRSEASALLKLLLTPGQPAYIQQAAESALRS